MTFDGTRTITLTDRPPVRIVENDWLTIASVRRHDGETYLASLRRYWMTVRQHQDGRTIVYGRHQTQHFSEEGIAGGELLNEYDPIEVISAIHRVGKTIGASDAIIAACIADLPIEDI
jgi:hypothetical protein